MSPMANQQIQIGNVSIEYDDTSFAGSTIPAPQKENSFRIAMTHPVSGKKLFVVAYAYGFAIESLEGIEFWTPFVSIHNNNQGGSTNFGAQPELHVGDNGDKGGHLITSFISEDLQERYIEYINQMFDGTSHGNSRFIVRGSDDDFEFRAGLKNEEVVLTTVRTLLTEIQSLKNRLDILEQS